MEALAQLPDYNGLLVLELRDRFHEHFREALETMRGIIREQSHKKEESS